MPNGTHWDVAIVYTTDDSVAIDVTITPPAPAGPHVTRHTLHRDIVREAARCLLDAADGPTRDDLRVPLLP